MKRIALLQLGKRGDTILTTPLFVGLKQLYPESHLTVIASETAGIIPLHHEKVDETIIVPNGFAQLPTLTARLAFRRFDLYIDPKDHRSTASRYLAEIVHARERILHETNRPRFHAYDLLPAPAQTGHYVDKALAPLHILAPEQHFERRPSLTLPADARNSIVRKLRQDEGRIVILNISAGDKMRSWKWKKWEALVQRLPQEHSYPILSDPRERDFAKRIAACSPKAYVVETDTILEVAAALEMASAIITVDTSVIHLASAFNLPSVGLYAPVRWSARMFSPLSDRCVMLLAPDGHDTEAIEVDDVYNAAMSCLEL